MHQKCFNDLDLFIRFIPQVGAKPGGWFQLRCWPTHEPKFVLNLQRNASRYFHYQNFNLLPVYKILEFDQRITASNHIYNIDFWVEHQHWYVALAYQHNHHHLGTQTRIQMTCWAEGCLGPYQPYRRRSLCWWNFGGTNTMNQLTTGSSLFGRTNNTIPG